MTDEMLQKAKNAVDNGYINVDSGRGISKSGYLSTITVQM